MHSYVVLCLCLFLVAKSQQGVQISRDGCPTSKDLVQNFNVKKYLGKWFEIESTLQIYDIGGKCPTADYSLDAATGRVNVKNSIKTIVGVNSVSGYAELDSKSGEAKLSVTLKVPVIGKVKAPYWVVDTDYDSYSVVYSCVPVINKKFAKVESGWILSRGPTLPESVKDKVERAIKKMGVDRKYFMKRTQNC